MSENNSAAPEDFAALLEEYGSQKAVRLSVGDQVEGKVIHITDTNVFVEISNAQEGVLPREELLDDQGELTLQVGDSVRAFVVNLRDGIELSRRVGREQINVELLENACRAGVPVEGTVSGFNKGGLEVAVGGTRGFCPMGQVDIEFVEDPSQWVGKTLSFQVREVKEGGRNVVLSRRALLEAERREAAAQLLATLEEGQEVHGKVTRLAKFGAFVDLGGIDGLIPISELSHGRVEDVADVVAEGQSVTVRVLKIEDDPKRKGEKRIGLSLRAANPHPLDVHGDALGEGTIHAGRVVRIEAFGAFVELFPGVEGLAHISELADRRIGHPREVVSLGDSVQAKVLSVDRERQRISLSLRAAAGGGEQPTWSVGDAAEATVDRVERYGLFVVLEGGGQALLPAVHSGTPRGTDLARAFPPGTKIAVEVIEIDERGRIKVSKTAREERQERADIEAYQKSGSGSGSGFGTTFGDLMRKKLK